MIDLALFRKAIRDQLRLPRLIAAGLLVALTLALALFARGRLPAERSYSLLASLLVFGFILVILSVVFGTGAVSQEMEDRTIVYLLTRPVPRWRILLAKFAACFLVTMLTCWLTLIGVALIAYGPAHLGQAHLPRNMAVLALGVLCYAGLSLLLATFSRWPLVFGLLYAFGWESWVPLLPGNFKRLSLMVYLRSLAAYQPDNSSEALPGGLASSLAPQVSATVSWIVLACVIFASLAAALAIFSDREYAPREDAE